MKKDINKKPYKKIALTLSLFLLVMWAVLGTGASLAWFTDTAEEVNNIFHFADFDLKVSHRVENDYYEIVDSQTRIFDENALYEPGYVQVVYLKIENEGDLDFTFKTAVNVTDFTRATNVFGYLFNLQDHLRFGVAIADTEAELDQIVGNRESAKKTATEKLGDYYEIDAGNVLPDGEKFIALVVYMPENVSNVVNYRGSDVPEIELGIIITAEQTKNR